MNKQTAVQLILDKFNLLSDNDFKSWMLNYHDELIQMEREQIEDAIEYGFQYGCRYANGEEGECNSQPYYEQTYGGQDEQQ